MVGRTHARGFVTIGVLGLMALGYLVLAWRAADLDAQVGVMDHKLAKAKFEQMQARRELSLVLNPCAVPYQTADTLQRTLVVQQDVVPCPQLPPVESSVLAEVTGTSAPALAQRPRSQPESTKLAALRLTGGKGER